MALIGYAVGSRYTHIMHGFSYAGYLLGGVVVIAIGVFFFHRFRSYQEAKENDPRYARQQPVDADADT
jgi:hypothetical protein